MRFLLLSLLLSSAALADTWTVDPQQSSITITADIYEGEPFIATFATWDADITFDPADLASANLIATIQTASFTATNPDDNIYAFEATGADWFFSDQFESAIFESESFTGADGNYTVQGTLSIKGTATPLSFPFTLSINGDEARMSGALTLNREDLSLGMLTHPSDTTVGYEVSVAIEIVAGR